MLCDIDCKPVFRGGREPSFFLKASRWSSGKSAIVEQKDPAANKSALPLSDSGEIDCSHFSEALWNMQMILKCMFAGKTNIICAHMGNNAARDMKVARKNHEQGFNVGSPGNYSERRLLCDPVESDGESHMAANDWNY